MVYAKFKIEQDQIIKTICVQRNFQKNSCQGHCALKKSLKQLEENQRDMENNLKEKTELVYISYSMDSSSIFQFPFGKQPSEKNYYHGNKKPVSVVLTNFRPPSISV